MKHAVFPLALLCMPAVAQEAYASAEQGRYRLSGTESLRPVAIGDDGQRTYIEWSADQQLPAVFALKAFGEEEMVDGYMRGQTYTIDRVIPRLIFRVNRTRAEARRIVPGRPK